MKRQTLRDAVAYLRVSDPNQVNEGNSLPTQKAQVEAWALEHGLRITAWYSDDGISASHVGKLRATATRVTFDVSRPRWGQLVADLLSNPQSPRVLVVQDQDRVSRNDADLYLFKSLIAEGVEVHDIRERKILNRDNIGAETLMIGIKGAVASEESRKKGERIKDVTKQAHDEGKHTGPAPIGLRWTYPGNKRVEKGTLVIDERMAPKIRTLFKVAATGTLGLSDLFRKAVELGLWGPRSSPSRTRLLLTHPIYIGGFRRQGPRSECIDTLEGNNPVIVERRVWDRVQTLYFSGKPQRRHGARAAKTGNNTPTHVLAGVFHHDGLPLTHKTDRHCYRWRDDAGHWHQFRDDILLKQIADHVIGPLHVDAAGLDAFRDLLYTRVAESIPKKADLERERASRQREADRVLRLLSDGSLELSAAEDAKLRKQRSAAVARIKEVDAGLAEISTMTPTAADIATILRYVDGLGAGWLTEKPESQRLLLLQILDFEAERAPIELDEDGQISSVAYAPGWAELSQLVLEADRRVAVGDEWRWQPSTRGARTRAVVAEAEQRHADRLRQHLRVITAGSGRGSGARGCASAE